MSASQFDPRITAYFGDAVLRAGFMPLPHLFLRHYRRLGLSHLQAMFVLQLMEIAWDLGDPPTTVTKLAERLGVERRTVQICSREVHKLGLIEIYDQWDEGGAQVENGYDLSPLFRALAALAPEPKPAGQLRTRRTRYVAPETSDITETIISPPRSLDRPAPRSADHPLPRSLDRSSGDQPDQGGVDPRIAGDVIGGSGLNRSVKKQAKKPQESEKKHQNPPAQPVHLKSPVGGVGGLIASADEDHAAEKRPEDARIGRSLRWNTRLSATEVAASQRLLDYVGLRRRVAQAVAPTLHPAEVWALWIYARAARLTPAWIAKQVYDFVQERPRPADLSSRYDQAGRLLARLEQPIASQLIELIDLHCPQSPEYVASDPMLSAEQDQRAAGDAVWAVMAEQRGGSLRLPLPRSAPLRDSDGSPTEQSERARLWQVVQERLAQALDATAYTTWLEPTVLLDIAEDRAVIGAPNCIARDHVAAVYEGEIASALAATLGRTIEVEVVINQLVPG